jgi:hypothetical protein
MLMLNKWFRQRRVLAQKLREQLPIRVVGDALAELDARS